VEEVLPLLGGCQGGEISWPEVISFSYWSIKPWFLTEGKLLLCSSYIPLGVSQLRALHNISVEEVLPLLGGCQGGEISWLWVYASKSMVSSQYIEVEIQSWP
jgi:hypothetical protein